MSPGPNSEETEVNKDQYVWYIASTQRKPSGASRTFNVGAPITNAEYRSYRSDVELLEEALAKSPFAALQERCMEFMRATSDALEAFKAASQLRRSRQSCVASSKTCFLPSGGSQTAQHISCLSAMVRTRKKSVC